MAAWRRRAARWLGRSRPYQRAVEQAAALVALTENDAAAIAGIFGISRDRIRIVPVAVNSMFFDAKPDLWRSQYGLKPFALCVGAIQKRKNQLRLVKSCTDAGLAVVLVGSVLPGQLEYGNEVQRAMIENQKLGGRWLRCEDNLLASAYSACKIFVLLSDSETQPASVLQAMAARKPILLGNAPYAESYPFKDLPRVHAQEGEVAIKRALLNVWTETPPSALPTEFTEATVCERLAAIYGSVLGETVPVRR